MKVWVLKSIYSNYEQYEDAEYGEHFLGVFSSKKKAEEAALQYEPESEGGIERYMEPCGMDNREENVFVIRLEYVNFWSWTEELVVVETELDTLLKP